MPACMSRLLSPDLLMSTFKECISWLKHFRCQNYRATPLALVGPWFPWLSWKVCCNTSQYWCRLLHALVPDQAMVASVWVHSVTHGSLAHQVPLSLYTELSIGTVHFFSLAWSPRPSDVAHSKHPTDGNLLAYSTGLVWSNTRLKHFCFTQNCFAASTTSKLASLHIQSCLRNDAEHGSSVWATILVNCPPCSNSLVNKLHQEHSNAVVSYGFVFSVHHLTV